MIYVTSDLHGHMDCLQKLLAYVDFYGSEDNWLYILGDVIDRNNNGGVDILKWLLVQPNVQLILGNHEQMLLSNRWIFQEISDDSISSINSKDMSLLHHWELNGGGCTMEALSQEPFETRKDILEYLEECPLIEGVCVNGKNYVLVHSGLGNFSKTKKLTDYTQNELLWVRPGLETEYNPEKYVVILGHTPTSFYSREYKNRILKTESWWDIDTGAAASDGRPMLLCLDNGKEYYIDDKGVVFEE